MIELFVIKETEWLELVTESVSLEGQRYQAPRSITAKIITKQGTHSYYSVSEGDTVLGADLDGRFFFVFFFCLIFRGEAVLYSFSFIS